MNTTPDKKLTPMAAHIEWLKKERKACYELCHDEQVKCFDDAIKHATSLLEAEREYASQQAPEWYSELLDKEIERINKRLLIEDDNLKQRQLVSEIQYIEGVKQFIKSIK